MYSIARGWFRFDLAKDCFGLVLFRGYGIYVFRRFRSQPFWYSCSPQIKVIEFGWGHPHAHAWWALSFFVHYGRVWS